MKRGEVVVIDFPFSDGSARKRRPALVVQADSLVSVFPDTLVVSISTTARGGATHVLIDSGTDPHSGLRVPCGIRCELIHAIDEKTILGSVGRLSKRTMQMVDVCLKTVLGLS